MTANAQNTNPNSRQTINAVLSGVTLLLVAFSTFGGNPGVQRAIEEVEAMKVGGSENYAIVQKIYSSDAFKAQQKSSLEAAQQQMEGSAAAPTEPTADTAPAEPAKNTITKEQLEAIKKMGYWDGAKDGKIILLEYSDLQCPFCKRHHDNGTIKSLLEKYSGKISHSFRNFPLSFHQFAAPGANAVFCAADQNADNFYPFINAVFAKSLGAEQTLFDVAKELKLDEAKFKDCMDKKTFAATVTAEMNEGQSLFGVTGTPGNIMINTETLEWVSVAGAYPASEFEKTLDLWTK